MASVKNILKRLSAYKRTPESGGVKWRLNLAEMVIRRLNINGWSQRQLADKVGMNEVYISRILHSDVNCTFNSAGRILFALGIEASLIPDQQSASMEQDYSHGEEIEQEGDTAEQGAIITFITQAGSSGYVQTAEAVSPVAQITMG